MFVMYVMRAMYVLYVLYVVCVVYVMYVSSSRVQGAHSSPPLKKRQYYSGGQVDFKILIPTLHEKLKKKRFLRSMGSNILRLTTPLA